MHLIWISDGGAGVSSGSHLLFNLWLIVVETAQVKKSHLKLCQICLTNLQHLLSYSEKENRLEKWMWSSFNVLLSKVKMAQIIAAQWDNSKCIRFIKRRQPFMPYSDIEGFFSHSGPWSIFKPVYILVNIISMVRGKQAAGRHLWQWFIAHRNKGSGMLKLYPTLLPNISCLGTVGRPPYS